MKCLLCTNDIPKVRKNTPLDISICTEMLVYKLVNANIKKKKLNYGYRLQ
jgi:hypothetical protein